MSITEVRTSDAPAAVIDSRGSQAAPLSNPRTSSGHSSSSWQRSGFSMRCCNSNRSCSPGARTGSAACSTPSPRATPAGWRTRSPGTHRTCITTRSSATASSRSCSSSSPSGSSGSDHSNPRWRSPLSGPWASGGSEKVSETSFTVGATPFGGGPGAVLFYAVLAVLLWPSEGSDRPFVAARTVGVTAAKAIWAVRLGPLRRLGRRRLGSVAPGAARLGGRLHRTARLACPHRSGHCIDVPPSRHDGRDPPRRGLCGRGGRGLPSSAVHQGHTGPRDRDLRVHLGGHRELRRDPGRRGHRPQFRTTGHHPGVDLLAVGHSLEIPPPACGGAGQPARRTALVR